MLEKTKKLAIYMEGNLNSDHGKMGFGIMRYSENPITCVVDSQFEGRTVREAVGLPHDIPVVRTMEQAQLMGAEIMVLGTAPSGGRFPEAWVQPVEFALKKNMSLINGLHDNLNERFGSLLNGENPDQVIWDVRKPTFLPRIAQARAAELNNKRVLIVGTDMAAGKMTTGLELYKWLGQQGKSTEFIATGQIGITIMGKGVPLDAVIVDQACGAIEKLVLDAAAKDIVIVEGQGSLLHPGSTATLPLMRGSCATHLILCHIAGRSNLRQPTHIKTPPLKEFIELNEALTGVCGSLTRAKTIGVALNTFGMSDAEANEEIDRIENETGLPATDVVRFGVDKLGHQLLD